MDFASSKADSVLRTKPKIRRSGLKEHRIYPHNTQSEGKVSEEVIFVVAYDIVEYEHAENRQAKHYINKKPASRRRRHQADLGRKRWILLLAMMKNKRLSRWGSFEPLPIVCLW